MHIIKYESMFLTCFLNGKKCKSRIFSLKKEIFQLEFLILLALVIPPKFFVPVGEKIRKNGGTLYVNMFGLKSGSNGTCLNDE